MPSYKIFHIILSACLLLTTTSCNASNQFLTKVTESDYTLELFNYNQQCTLKYNKKTYPLNINFPCGFVRANNQMNAQKYHYKDVGTVFIVASAPEKDKTYTEDDGVKPEHMCSNQGQAIIINKGEVILRKEQTIKLGFCHQLGFDEKVFYGYAYPVE